MVPKAPVVAAFGPDDEEEKTTIESGWEEEASTTVEQGEVAEKLRLGDANGHANGHGRRQQQITNVTSTNATNGSGSVVDEPTVDDQRAMAGLSLITPPMLSRLVITAGNDSGQELEIQPNKSYTIGRAIDNDIVLTDIAVSRKHFDLRFDAGAWLIVDRGSGNGTLVNGNIEDAPFILANGDSIEIGNTVFRFEAPNGIPPSRRPNGSKKAPVEAPPHFDIDEEEPSTVAGKPVREEMPAHAPMPPPALRPKTQPPPAPLPRPRAMSQPPPLRDHNSQFHGAQGSAASVPIQQAPPPLIPALQPQQQPPMPPPQQLSPQALAMQAAIGSGPPLRNAQGQASTLPMPQMQQQHGRPPPMPLQPVPPAPMPQPQMLHAHPQMHGHNHPHPAMPGMMPTTIPGQGPPMHPSQPHLPYAYPSVNDMGGHNLLVAPNGHHRNDMSTAHVPPMTFSNGAVAVAQPYRPAGISLRTKLLLGGAGLTILAAIATIAIIKGTSSSDSEPSEETKTEPDVTPIESGDKPDGAKKDLKGDTKTDAKKDGKDQIRVEPIKDGKPLLVLDAKLSHEGREPRPNALLEPVQNDADLKADEAKKKEELLRKEEELKKQEEAKKEEAKKAELAKKEEAAKKDELAKKEEAAKKAELAKKEEAAKNDAAKKAELAKKEEAAKNDAAKKAELAKKEEAAKNDAAKKAELAKKEEEAKKAAEKKRLEALAKKDEPKETKEPKEKTVAVASTAEVNEVRARADALYREKRFKDAAQALRVKASTFTGRPASELGTRAGAYEAFGAAYNIGMGQGTPAKEAYRSLNTALTYDNQLGGVYTAEIRAQLSKVAPAAAAAFLTGKDFALAAAALRLADSLGTGNNQTGTLVRRKLEERAGELYREAERLADSDPSAARRNIAQINAIAADGSPWRAKAKALKIP